jgi:hypothetical protein
MSQKVQKLLRCHTLGSLMTGAKPKLTVNQLEELERLAVKRSEGKLTVKQTKTLADLETKRDVPAELSKTVQKILKQYIRWVKYNKQNKFSNKYTEKGIEVEDDSIALISLLHKKYYKKNIKRYNDGTISGEMDIDAPDLIIDAKSKWDCDTYDSQEGMDSDHFYQGLGYCRLRNKKKFGVAYTLVNTPESLILNAFTSAYYKKGAVDLTDQDKAEIAINMVFTNTWFDKNEDGGVVKRTDYWEVLKSAHYPNAEIEFVEIPDEKRLKYYEVEYTE